MSLSNTYNPSYDSNDDFFESDLSDTEPQEWIEEEDLVS